MHEEIKIRLKTDNACNLSVLNRLSFCLLTKNIKMSRNIILPVCLFCMGVKLGR